MRYRTIVADPPWPIEWSVGKTTAGKSSGSVRTYNKKALPYSTMTVGDMAALDVESLSQDDAHLFMWTLDRFVMDGSASTVCRAWGFEPLPQMIVWNKPNAGLGRILRPAHELIMVGRRGAARLNEISARTVQEWQQVYENGSKKHSAKPDGSFDFIESLSEGPRLEMFSRRGRLGWDSWGDESLGHVEMAT